MTPRTGKRNLFCGIAAAVSALLLWAAFPPHSESFSVLVALVPVMVVSRTCVPRVSALTLFLSGLCYWLLSLSWMPAIVKNNGPWPLVLLGWFALAAYCALYFAAYGWISSFLWRRKGERAWLPPVACIFAEAGIWVLLEWARAVLFSGFAWNFLGTAFASMPSFSIPARIGGVYLVSALAVLLNGVFATLLIRVFAPVSGWRIASSAGGSRFVSRLAQMGETGLPLLAILACLCAGNGIVRDEASARNANPVHLRVALVQRNAACCFKPGPKEDAYEAFGRLLDSVSAVKPDVVVLAESAMAEFGAVRSFRAQDVARGFLERSGARYLIAGGDDVVSNRTYNAAALYARDGSSGVRLVDVYHKQHLVPFGEYIPLDKTFTALQKLSPIGVSLHPGEPKLFAVKASSGAEVRIAPLICYEDTDPRLAACAREMGADMIVLITNDSWFSESHEAEAHASQAVLRAVETGLPVVRVGNSGVSGVIRPDGSANWLSGASGHPIVDGRGVMVETVVVQAVER